MKRRKAIGTILLAGGVTVAGFGGYEWYSLVRDPDKKYLLSKKTLLTELAETIIPATDTPGAKEAGAVDYMMNMLMECTDKKTLNRFITGLQELEAYTHSNYQRDFTECSEAEKGIIVQHFEEKSRPSHSLYEKAKNRFTGYPFFMALKTYAVFGYCISEKGASMGMHYIAVPGKYLSCIPMDPNQKAWATK